MLSSTHTRYHHLFKSQTKLLYNHNNSFQHQHYNSNPLINSLINQCSSIPICQSIHSTLLKSLHYNEYFIGDRLVSLYAKLGLFKDALKLFDEMPQKDLVSWNSIISAFSRNGYVGLCLDMFLKMRNVDGMRPNEITLISLISACGVVEGGYMHGFGVKSGLLWERKVLNALVNMYGKCGCWDAGCEVFEMIELPNLVSWNSVIKILVQSGSLEKSVLYFNLMRREGVYPDQATIVTILQGCGDVGVGKLVDAFHGNIFCSGLAKSIPTVTALLNVYAKSGRLKSSSVVFNEIKEPDMIAWTAMLAAYAMHGYGRQAIEHFNFMVQKGHEPDHVTFTHLLSACSHSGLVNEGKRYFNIMSAVYKVKPKLEHYSCMVDLYGRSGLLTDARVLIDNMPMEPNSGVWGALLNGCKVYGNIELGEEVAGRLIALDPSDSRNYIMLSSIYSKAGRWADFSKVRALMKEQGLVRTAGCSFIEHDHQIHRFLVSDQAHPDSERIYAKLDQVIEKIGKAGYVPNTDFVLHDVEEEFKRDFVKKHSEKLAIAFGLLVYSDNVPIIITKNLRICGDCHNMAKFVSLVEKRVIIIRDTRRFHHFADGLCSCGDYW